MFRAKEGMTFRCIRHHFCLFVCLFWLQKSGFHFVLHPTTSCIRHCYFLLVCLFWPQRRAWHFVAYATIFACLQGFSDYKRVDSILCCIRQHHASGTVISFWYVFSDYKGGDDISLHPPPFFLVCMSFLTTKEWIPFCVASDNIMHPALLFPSGMSFLTIKEGMTFRCSLQSAQHVRQSINEWVSYPYWWHFVASVTIISFVVCLFWLPKNLLHFVASATVISFATCRLWSLWLLLSSKK